VQFPPGCLSTELRRQWRREPIDFLVPDAVRSRITDWGSIVAVDDRHRVDTSSTGGEPASAPAVSGDNSVLGDAGDEGSFASRVDIPA
jgi:hypothetical protein